MTVLSECIKDKVRIASSHRVVGIQLGRKAYQVQVTLNFQLVVVDHCLRFWLDI